MALTRQAAEVLWYGFSGGLAHPAIYKFPASSQVSKMQYDKIFSYIDAGKQAGAKCILGGQKRPGKGYYVDPTSKRIICADKI